jgi:hypothetical protein
VPRFVPVLCFIKEEEEEEEEEENSCCWGKNACAEGKRRARNTARTRARSKDGNLTDAIAAVLGACGDGS